MNLKMKLLNLLSLSLLLAACSPAGGEVTITPTPAGSKVAIAPSPTGDEAAMSPSPTAPENQTYQNDNYSLQYPGDVTFYENERPSADEVIAPLPDSIALQGSNYLLTLTTFVIESGSTLADFIDSHQECMALLPGEPTAVGNLPALLFTDTPCGLAGTTYLYAVAGDTGYRFAVETADSFAAVQADVQPILDSFHSEMEPLTSVQVNHDDVTFTYDPMLLGDVQIQEIAATANQGMFDQPSPAHTWFGFVPPGIQRDSSNHWFLALEPSMIVYNLNDFGSFALGDQYARERVAAFQTFAEKQPTFFTDQVPLILPINAGQIIHAQVKWLDFGNGIGVRFLTQFDQSANPINNEGLVYVFQGITADGLHGITAVFPLDAAGLPDGPAMSEPEYTNFIENFDAEMTAVTELLNSSADEDFTPPLSQLDALLQSLTISPTDNDYPITAVDPQNAQVLVDTTIFDAPNNETTLGNLSAGEAVVINGSSQDGRFSRILCLDGTTSNCWLPTETIQITPVDTPEMGLSTGFVDGQVVQIQAVIENKVFAGPAETNTLLGNLLAGEVAEVLALNESNEWYNIACPRNIGKSCWVVADTAVNEPIGYVSSDGWKNITSKYVSFRVPIEWETTAVTPGLGSVLAEWQLGIPNVESDQTVAFSAVPFANLKPDDVVREDPLEIGGQPALKWVRSGEGYISYDYYTAGTEATQKAGAGSFGLHVTVPEADLNLETTLNMVAASVIFNK